MGPKAKPAAKKAAGGNPENGGELTMEQQKNLFMYNMNSLQVQLGEFCCVDE